MSKKWNPENVFLERGEEKTSLFEYVQKEISSEAAQQMMKLFEPKDQIPDFEKMSLVACLLAEVNPEQGEIPEGSLISKEARGRVRLLLERARTFSMVSKQSFLSPSSSPPLFSSDEKVFDLSSWDAPKSSECH